MVVGRYISNIAISVDIDTGSEQDGNLQLPTITGKDPVTDLPQDFHVLDTTAANMGGGPGIYQPTISGISIVLLLCGGDKSTQDADIKRALKYWQDHQERNRP